VKLNTTISVDNLIALATIICGIILAFGFMQYDIDMIKRDLELKLDKKEAVADRKLITYKLDVITADIAEMKESLEQIKGEIHGLHK
jgi:ABC-type phosphate transport system auxiliary subunit|tara:strand:- start:359 stop:619 length:261 start_codon:yes stop_codon:yes gene_type:complete